MALINCPECNKEISDKAKVCIHCGYPIAEYLQSNNNAKESEYKQIRLTNFYDNKVKAIALVREITGLGLKEAKDLTETYKPVIITGLNIEDAKKVRVMFGNKDIEVIIEDDNISTERTILKTLNNNMTQAQNFKQPSKTLNIPDPHLPKCPMCGSTNIQKISDFSRASSILGFGILSKKIGKQWQCNNPKCKHLW